MSKLPAVENVAVGGLAEARRRKTKFDNAPERPLVHETWQEMEDKHRADFCACQPGLGYAITRKALEDRYGNSIDNYKFPGCAYLLTYDRLTDNYIVVRLPDDGDEGSRNAFVADVLKTFRGELKTLHGEEVVHTRLEVIRVADAA